MNFNILYLYIVLSIIHLYACFFKKAKIRFTTKPFIMIILFALYYTSTQVRRKELIASIFLAFLGDVFLMYEKLFWYGVISFWCSDFLYLIIFSRLMPVLNLTYLSTLITLYVTFYIFVAYKNRILTENINFCPISVGYTKRYSANKNNSGRKQCTKF